MDTLREHMHLVWKELNKQSKKLTVKNTCEILMQSFPGEYEAFATENNFTNRLRYYQTNFRKEKAFYQEINACVTKRKRLI